MNEFIIIALASQGRGISGGDRIFIELARKWSKKFTVKLVTTSEGVEMINRQNLKGNFLVTKNISEVTIRNFYLNYVYKIYLGIKFGLTSTISGFSASSYYLYSASEFWMDSLTCVILKIRYPKLVWIATWFQTAPNPLKGYAEGKRGVKYRSKALFYWLIQLPIKPLINKYADKVIVNNENERKQFPKHKKRGDSIVLIGAVPLKDIEKWKLKRGVLPKKYDAVFQGRFHPQKGVTELVDIWKNVVKKRPDSKLAMIGDGPLMPNVMKKILEYKLKDNIKLYGYVFDGPKKNKIFSQSKIVVHPSYYDSGGMATAEAMAFGLPAIAFNLKAYESYYPKGMVKVEKESEFSKAILDLLEDNKKREKIGKEAQELIKGSYSWDFRADEILGDILR